MASRKKTSGQAARNDSSGMWDKFRPENRMAWAVKGLANPMQISQKLSEKLSEARKSRAK